MTEAEAEDGAAPPAPTAAAHDGRVGDKRQAKVKSWYPLVAPSLVSLAPSGKSGESSFRLSKCVPHDTRSKADPWVARCRVAAAVGGALILIGFIVAMVFASGVRP